MPDRAAVSPDPAPGPGLHEPPVLVHRTGALTRISLNRPRAINALSRAMVELLPAAIAAARDVGSRAILIDGRGDRGFCGGGDVKEMAAGGPEAAREFLRAEYRADYAVHASTTPVVAVMDGIAMGGGIGLAGHASVRVVTERSRLAMPEARIGIAPDVGGHLLLGRAPGRLGELLAVTAGSMDAGDALALGFADHLVPAERLDELRERLAAGDSPDDAVADLAIAPPPSSLLQDREWFDPIAEAALGDGEDAFEDPVGAATRLLRALEDAPASAARRAAEAARGMCPVSLAVTLAQLARTRARSLDLAAVLADDLRIVGRLVERPDFREGVRAHLIDRDGAASWDPAQVEELDPTELARVLAPPVAGERPLALP